VFVRILLLRKKFAFAAFESAHLIDFHSTAGRCQIQGKTAGWTQRNFAKHAVRHEIVFLFRSNCWISQVQKRGKWERTHIIDTKCRMMRCKFEDARAKQITTVAANLTMQRESWPRAKIRFWQRQSKRDYDGASELLDDDDAPCKTDANSKCAANQNKRDVRVQISNKLRLMIVILIQCRRSSDRSPRWRTLQAETLSESNVSILKKLQLQSKNT